MTTTAPTAAPLSDQETAPRRPVDATLTSVQPVVPGFHPDPSVCRVGDDYYLACSSFEYSPGVPLWHSTDLLTWDLVGNVLERADQFTAATAGASQGVYAPTLRHHDGRFWLVTTDVSGGGGQLLVSTEDPRGPWSSATRIPGLVGIDPDLAWSADGTCYVTYCSTTADAPGITQARVDLTSGEVLDGPRRIWQGSGLAHPEAPHLYEHDGWWYLVIAEGGTERGHTVAVARSTSPEGPFEPAPHNPMLTHRSTAHPVQNTGHADLVELADGSWAVVYLGVRPAGTTPLFHVNGRETFLAGIDWADGWPVVDEHRFSQAPVDRSFVEEFDGPRLHPRWVVPSASVDEVVREQGQGRLVLAPVQSPSGDASILAARTAGLRWRAETDVDAAATSDTAPESAVPSGAVSSGAVSSGAVSSGVALRVRLDDAHWCEVLLEAGVARAVVRIGPLESQVGTEVAVGAPGVTLVVEAADPTHAGPDDLRLLVSQDGTDTELARVDGRYLSTEVAGGFTGRVVGVRAVGGPAVVHAFRYVDRG